MSTLAFILGVLFMATGIAVSIALHEVGHLVPAKRFGVRVTQYMVGFGPTMWSRRRGETEYGVKAIPLGGYIRMIGMFPPRTGDDPGTVRVSSTGRFSQLVDEARAASLEEVRPGDENRVFYKLSVPKKVTVMLGGPLMNLALAFVMLTILMSGIGVQSLVPTVSTVAQCIPQTPPTVAKPFADCVAGDPKAPSVAAGLQAGDTIVEVGGVPVQLWAEATAKIRASAGQPLDLMVERTGTRVPLTVQVGQVVRPTFTEEGKVAVRADGTVITETVGYLGASASVGYVRQPLSAVPGELGRMLGATASVLLRIPEKMVGVFEAVTGQSDRDPNGPVSVVGVARAGGEIVSGQYGPETGQSIAYRIIGLIFGLNLALFLFNLVPLLPLDGGQVVGALWEGVKKTWARLRGRPDPGYVDVAKALPIAYAVSTVLIAMTLLLAYADLVTPIKLG